MVGNKVQDSSETQGLDEFQLLAKSSPWWGELYDEMSRGLRNYDFADQLDIELKLEICEVIIELDLIRPKDIEQALTNKVFEEAIEIIAKLNPGDTFPNRLTELYELRKVHAIERIVQNALKLISLLSNKRVRKEAERLWDTNHSQLLLWLKEVPEKLNIQDVNQRYILRSLIELAQLLQRLKEHRKYPFGSKTYYYFTIGKDRKRNRVNYLAYRVYDPLWKDLMERFEPEYVTFPLRWASAVLPIAVIRNLQETHKAGKDLIEEILKQYQQEEFLNELQERIADCPHTNDLSELFDEIVQVFRSSHYRVCSQALLSMTEGLLWRFARLWNNLHDNVFEHPVTDAQFKKSKFKLVNRDGTVVRGTPSIGALLRYTTVGDAISYEFVEHYCQELFRERNQVLHGREPDYGNEKKVAVLFFMVSTIERRMLDSAKDFARNKAIAALKAHKKATSKAK